MGEAVVRAVEMKVANVRSRLSQNQHQKYQRYVDLPFEKLRQWTDPFQYPTPRPGGPRKSEYFTAQAEDTTEYDLEYSNQEDQRFTEDDDMTKGYSYSYNKDQNRTAGFGSSPQRQEARGSQSGNVAVPALDSYLYSYDPRVQINYGATAAVPEEGIPEEEPHHQFERVSGQKRSAESSRRQRK